MPKLVSLETVLAGRFEQPWENLPVRLRKAVEQRGPILARLWNVLGPERRQAEARTRDWEANPEFQRQHERLFANATEIIDWEAQPHSTAEGKAAKQQAIGRLEREQRALDRDILGKRANAKREERIERWAAYQRKRRRGWCNIADIVEAWCRQTGGPPSEANRADAYAGIIRDAVAGDFDGNGKSRLLLLAADSATARTGPVTGELLRDMQTFYPPDDVAQFLAMCWMPRSVFLAWTAKHGFHKLRQAISPQRRSAPRNSGQLSKAQEMQHALTELRSTGRTFSSNKLAHNAVKRLLNVPDGKRGYSYQSFCRHCSGLR